jgi:hypothetical protein
MYSPDDGEFIGAEILCQGGGPTVIVDTRRERVEGDWGTDHIDFGVDCRELNYALTELYQRV